MTPLTEILEPVRGPVYRVYQFLTSSVFRFLILLGLVLLAAGAVIQHGVIAGHLGLYGATAVFVGVLGRLIIRWKLKHST